MGKYIYMYGLLALMYTNDNWFIAYTTFKNKNVKGYFTYKGHINFIYSQLAKMC